MRASNHTETTDSEISRQAFDAFCTDLLKGLHAAAQPLTILRAGLSEDCTGHLDLDGLRDLAQTCGAETERLSGMFSMLKQLVQAEQFGAKCTTVPLLPLITESLQEFRLSAPRAEMTVSIPETLPAVLAETRYADQALTLMLKIASAVTGEQCRLEFAAELLDDEVELQLRDPKLNLHALSSENALAFALAEARTRGQHGRLTCALQPFTLTAAFRIAPSKNEGNGR